MNSKKKYEHIPLNESDLEVEAFIQSHLVREGYSPSQREVARQLEKHHFAIQVSVKKLIAHGKLEINSKTGKDLKPVSRATTTPLHTVPLLGKVAAGAPIEAIEMRESIEVPAWMMKPSQSYFVLQVKGKSMIEDQIDDGDYVLIRKAQEARNGERVVALINNEATLKRFERKNGRILLHPANETMTAIEIGPHQELRIAGIFSGVLRRAE